MSGAEQHYALGMCSQLFETVLGARESFGRAAPYRKVLPPGAYPLQFDNDAAFIHWLSLYIGPGAMIVGDNPLIHPQTGEKLSLYHLSLNTAVAIGSAPILLLAKLAAQCEIHCYVEGPNRAWLAGIIEAGLHDNILRTWKNDSYPGWPGVVDLLKKRDDEPVVCSYSVTSTFPNHAVAIKQNIWTPEIKHDTIQQKYHLEDEDNPVEWESSYLSELWCDLPESEQWDKAMAALRKANENGHLEIDPETLGTQGYGNGMSAFDLVAAMKEE